MENGKNEFLGSARTEFMNPYLISVCSNDRHQRGVKKSKKLSYLLDLKTIALEDLVCSYSLGQIIHDSKIDCLELSETGRKFPFRGKGGLIEFATATNDGDLNRAFTFLESLEMSAETGSMWRTLTELSLEGKQLQIVERKTSNIGEAATDTFCGIGLETPDVGTSPYILVK